MDWPDDDQYDLFGKCGLIGVVKLIPDTVEVVLDWLTTSSSWRKQLIIIIGLIGIAAHCMG